MDGRRQVINQERLVQDGGVREEGVDGNLVSRGAERCERCERRFGELFGLKSGVATKYSRYE